MPGMVKIGFSASDPLKRAKALDGTGTPKPFVVEYDMLATDAQVFEYRVHKRLKDIRQRDCREWFACTPDEAMDAIRTETGTNAIAEAIKPQHKIDVRRE